VDHPSSLTLARDGAEYLPGVAMCSLDALLGALRGLPEHAPGLRLSGIPVLSRLLASDGAIGAIAARHMRAGARPVRALLFDKSPATNWALGWHQDRVIAVKRRIELPGFGPWTVKQGMVHVAPPFAVLAEMTTLRIHLDAVPPDNAPLLVAPGSHRAFVREADIEVEVARRGIAACLAEVGDAWIYSTPILHASDASARPARRRVLQIDYAAGELSGGLEWLGV